MNRWRLVAVLLVGSAASAAGALVLHWQPCRGFMLDASVLAGFADGNFSDACLRRMDAGLPFPYPPEPAEFTPLATGLGNLAMVFAALAGLVLALGLRGEVWLKTLLSVPALLTGLTAVVSALTAANPARDPERGLSLWLSVSNEIAAVVAVVVLVTDWTRQHGTRRTRATVIVLLWATTAFGLLHGAGDYLFMQMVSEADWDLPPGTGTVTVVVLLVGAAMAWFEGGRRPRGDLAGVEQTRLRPVPAGRTPAG